MCYAVSVLHTYMYMQLGFWVGEREGEQLTCVAISIWEVNWETGTNFE